MTVRIVKLPDVGEGIAEAELVEWHVAVGDSVTAESVLAEVMTDKATVEISAPVAGVITFITGAPGEVLSIGSDLAGIETSVDRPAAAPVPAAPSTTPLPSPPSPTSPTSPPSPPAAATAPPSPTSPPAAATASASAPTAPQPSAPVAAPPPRPSGAPVRPTAAPAVRQRARDLGIDLRQVHGTAAAGRITHADLDAYLAGAPVAAARSDASSSSDATHDVPIIGLRRRIATKMSESASRIPHITYVDEVDMTALEELRTHLNSEAGGDRPRVTVLPFLCRAIVRAAAEQPHVNATFDDVAGVLTTSDAAHIGIATQTPNGLVVPVVRHAGTLDLWQTSREIARLSAAARSGSATREELTGSTITITSLGALGGLVTTPIINHPEVAIVGVNKMQIRPVWDGHAFQPRMMMNLSSSFDHRIVDGWDAATFVQRLKTFLEAPALLFIDRPQS